MLFPGRSGWHQLLRHAAGVAVLTAAWTGTGMTVIDYPLNWLEVAAVWSSLLYVSLARVGNILNWPVGFAAFMVTGVFVMSVGMPGQAWMYMLYFAPLQFVGWARWARSAGTPQGEPSWLGWRGSLLAIGAVTTLTVAVRYLLAQADGGWMAWWDASIPAALAVGIWLLTRRRIEGWLLVAFLANLSAGAFHVVIGSYMVVAVYAAFFLNSSAAFLAWSRMMGAAAPQGSGVSGGETSSARA